jgi:Uma2 family endonuclease
MSRTNSIISRSEVSDELIHPGRKMSEQEFVDWIGDRWAEWVNGEVIVMSPVNFEHADVHSFLFRLIGGFVDDNELGKVVSEPFQIRFAKQKSRRSPDIIFISEQRLSIVKKQHAEGAPDLIVEIISPDSQSRDRREKFLEYQSVGVREYWIVDPLSEKIEAYSLSRDRKYKAIEPVSDRIPSKTLPGFYLKPVWFWRDKLPKVSALLREIHHKR